MKRTEIRLDHGAGGSAARELIEHIFMSRFANPVLSAASDSAVLGAPPERMAFTTDSHVVKPVEFPGGNIGKLAVAGTVNDLAVSGAKPLYLSAGFILEEGLSIELLERVVESMARTAEEAGVAIVTGDTKVVERGSCDGIFITTAGVGALPDSRAGIGAALHVQPGDRLIINGALAEHGAAIVCARNDLETDPVIYSDCAPLCDLIETMFAASPEGIRFMRDATRGGLATVVCELAGMREFRIELEEDALPVKEHVRGVCEMFGFDPLYLANEGKVVAVVAKEEAQAVLSAMRSHPLGREAAIFGTVGEPGKSRVTMNTSIGGSRVLQLLTGEQLPRIC